jgi:3-deoxy-D-manno-octulosonate 8-phosphate phosphatase KdsC-like HAD superfamily phosphatase
MISKNKCFILDVDGVMTTGQFLYTEEAREKRSRKNKNKIAA